MRPKRRRAGSKPLTADDKSRTARSLALLPTADVDGPRVRLGLAWAVVTVAATMAGPFVATSVFVVVALGAAGQACRSWRGLPRRPLRPVAILGAPAVTVAALLGPLAVVAVAVAVAVAAVVGCRMRPVPADERITIAIAVLIGVGAACPTLLLTRLGLVPALVFLLSIHAWDAGAFIVGSGARSRWEGPVAGLATVGALSLAVAALLVPPFRGASPWILAGVVGFLAPAGTAVATALLGRRVAAVPVLRRIDALLVAGPVWAAVGKLLLDLPR